MYWIRKDSRFMRRIMSRQFWIELRKKHEASTKWKTFMVKLQLATLEHAVLSKVEVMLYLELKMKVAKTILKHDTCLIWKNAMKYVLLRHRASHSRNCIYLTVLINKRMSEQSLNEPLSYLSKLLASNECNADWSSKQDKTVVLQLDWVAREAKGQR